MPRWTPPSRALLEKRSELFHHKKILWPTCRSLHADQIFDRCDKDPIAKQREGIGGSRQVLVTVRSGRCREDVDPADVCGEGERIAGPQAPVIYGEWQARLGPAQRR